MNEKVAIIGGGIGGLATACLLAKKGFKVQLFEKNDKVGGVANQFEAEGFTFDMGPSWYLMPDVFQNFFDLLDEKVEDHLDLVRLDPSYRIYFKDQNRHFDFSSDFERDKHIFEELEPGSSTRLREYLEKSKYQYEIALGGFMYKNYDTIFDFLNKQTATEGRELEVFSPMHKYVQKFFHADEVQKIMEYQLVFLGSSPYNTPALYNIMSHIDFNMGVWYPKGGIHEIPKALRKIGEKLSVEYFTNAPVERILTKAPRRAKGVRLQDGREFSCDFVVANASIEHVERNLISSPHRSHSDRYWDKKTLAPSAFILYLGLKEKLPDIQHHNLIFSEDWHLNFGEIFDEKVWPTDPSFYICAPSVTDESVAPAGQENLFVLVPIPPGLKADDAFLQQYRDRVLDVMQTEMNIPNLRDLIIYEKMFWTPDFAARYNTTNGTALGLAHTMTQTALLRPNNVSKKLKNLFYVGANTNPGIGMPIQLISAELAYKRVMGDKSASHLKSL